MLKLLRRATFALGENLFITFSALQTKAEIIVWETISSELFVRVIGSYSAYSNTYTQGPPSALGRKEK